MKVGNEKWKNVDTADIKINKRPKFRVLSYGKGRYYSVNPGSFAGVCMKTGKTSMPVSIQTSVKFQT